jgi:hypothetical protein
LNDGYKVQLTKDGKTVEGYLSQYPPADVAADTKEDKTSKGESWYMYSKPVTEVTQERKKVTWEGTDQGTPVVIPETEEGVCSLLVTDRSFALNGEAIGSLIFAYVLGQQSFYSEISPDQEKTLAKKLGKIDEFIDTQGNRIVDEEETEEQTTTESSEQKEKTEYDKFLDGWKALAGHDFPEDKETA